MQPYEIHELSVEDTDNMNIYSEEGYVMRVKKMKQSFSPLESSPREEAYILEQLYAHILKVFYKGKVVIGNRARTGWGC